MEHAAHYDIAMGTRNFMIFESSQCFTTLIDE